MAFTAVAAVGLGLSIFQGQKEKSSQKQAIRRQDKAQRQATVAAAGEQRRSEADQRRLNRRGPNRDTLLQGARRGAAGGAAGTLLTGAGGVSSGELTLGGGGRGSLLGG